MKDISPSSSRLYSTKALQNTARPCRAISAEGAHQVCQSFGTSTSATSDSESLSGSFDSGNIRRTSVPITPDRPSRWSASIREIDYPEITHRPDAYPTPPASDSEDSYGDSFGVNLSRPEQSTVSSVDRKYLQPEALSLPYKPKNGHRLGRRSGKRAFSTRVRGARSSYSADRFVSGRSASHDLSRTFRISKANNELTPSEKLFRNSASSPDPFGPLVLPRLRDRKNVSRSANHPTVVNRPRGSGVTNAIALPNETQNISTSTGRQASSGTVWNVGGISHAASAGPVRAISDGRGGFLGSGSHAPMYTAQFLDQQTEDQEIETMEGRIAAALELDRASRLGSNIHDTSSLTNISAENAGLQDAEAVSPERTYWKYGAWNQSLGSRKSIVAEDCCFSDSAIIIGRMLTIVMLS